MEQELAAYATGKRKTSVAKVWVKSGNGKIVVNKKPFDSYFPVESLRSFILKPLKLQDKDDEKYDIVVQVKGGGIAGQAGAIRHGISRAMSGFDENLRPLLKKDGMLTRDPRAKERKKYGQKKARKKFQYSKR